MPPVGSIARLSELRESLAYELEYKKAFEEKVIFPPPPVKGTHSIIPITDSCKLMEEGRHQYNCVASYTKQIVKEKRTYVYKVIAPERCTLALEKRNHKWELSQCYRAGNRAPSQKTWDHVTKWFENECKNETTQKEKTIDK